MNRYAAAALAALIALSCARNPATGARELMLVSESQEIAMGKESDPQVVAQMGVVNDERLQSYVASLGQRLAQASERPHLPWTFRVIDDPVVNAFAIPGGFIYVTRGIMAHLSSEAEFISVLGHEVGHVTARHSAAQMSKQQLAGIGLIAGVLIEPRLGRYAEAAQQGLGLLFLKFSRDDERQADELGLRYMRRTGYDPRQMPHVFERLGRVRAQSEGGRVPGWLSTHPDPGDRFKRITDAVSRIPAESLGRTVNRDDYLARINGMVYGANPRAGFFRNGVFYHPDLEFKIAFPEGWKTSNQASAVMAMSPQQDAVVGLMVEARGATPESAARTFFSQQGIQGSPGSVSINGLPAQSGEFAGQTEQGVVQGLVVFVSYGGQVYRLMGYAPQPRWPAYRNTASRMFGSFDRLTDASILRIQPQRVSVVTLPRAMTVAEFAQAYPGPVAVKELALLNNVAEDGRFAAGAKVKRVVGEALPQ
jgi:predicted Zn-dependent protease